MLPALVSFASTLLPFLSLDSLLDEPLCTNKFRITDQRERDIYIDSLYKSRGLITSFSLFVLLLRHGEQGETTTEIT